MVNTPYPMDYHSSSLKNNMKPSYKELFTKILVSYDTMDPNFLYYLDEDDYHIKRVDKKTFNYFKRHYADLTYSDDPNSEEYLFAALILDSSKHFLPMKYSEVELKKAYELSGKEESFNEFKNAVYTTAIDVWLDFHDIFEIECTDDFYTTIFDHLATIFASGLFNVFSRRNILHFESNGMHYFYSFNHKDMSFTITTSFFGLSNMQCTLFNSDVYDKQMLRALREAYVITFKNESRCTQDTIKLYERFENEYTDFGQYVPKIAYYRYGLLQENGLRLFEGHDLSNALNGLLLLINGIVSQDLAFDRNSMIKCVEKHNEIQLGVEDNNDPQVKEPFINLYPFRQLPQNVKINKDQIAEFVVRVSSTKKISKTTKAAVFETLMVDADNGDVLFRNFVVAGTNTIQDLILPILEYGITNGFPERIISSNLLDAQILAVLTANKSKLLKDDLKQIKQLDKDEENSSRYMA